MSNYIYTGILIQYPLYIRGEYIPFVLKQFEHIPEGT
jgi:hypothetical protein